MNFKLGNEYIVKVSEKGIVPIEEFDRSRWYDKDSDDLDFLTDEEKTVVINDMINKIRSELIEEKECAYADFLRYKVKYLGQGCQEAYDSLPEDDFRYGMERAIEIIDKYKTR